MVQASVSHRPSIKFQSASRCRLDQLASQWNLPCEFQFFWLEHFDWFKTSSSVTSDVMGWLIEIGHLRRESRAAMHSRLLGDTYQLSLSTSKYVFIRKIDKTRHTALRSSFFHLSHLGRNQVTLKPNTNNIDTYCLVVQLLTPWWTRSMLLTYHQ